MPTGPASRRARRPPRRGPAARPRHGLLCRNRRRRQTRTNSPTSSSTATAWSKSAVGTQSNGQGHETAYAQVLAERLGIPMDQVRIVQGDTDRLDQGNGTGGSRSAWRGAAPRHCRPATRRRSRHRAGQDRARCRQMSTIGRRVPRPRHQPHARASPSSRRYTPVRSDGRARYKPADPRPTFPNGCHIAEVEIDPDTGVTEIAALQRGATTSVPSSIRCWCRARSHGGVAQGVGQALMEDIRLRQRTASSSPARSWTTPCRAPTTCRPVDVETHPVPTQTNPLGVKGCRRGRRRRDAGGHQCHHRRAGRGPIEMPATVEKVWAPAGRFKRGWRPNSRAPGGQA